MTSTRHPLTSFCVRHRGSRVAVPIVLFLLEVVALVMFAVLFAASPLVALAAALALVVPLVDPTEGGVRNAR